MKRFLKILKYLVYLLLLLIVGILVVLKIPATRQYILQYALDAVNSSLKGKIYAEDIDFVNLNGIKLTHASLIAGCDTVAYVPEAFIKLSAFPMIDNTISLQSIELNSPVIKILRSKDSTMNVEHIAYPSEDTLASTENTNLKILVDRIRIKKGRFELIDSLQLTDNRKQINYSDMIFDNMDLDVSAHANLFTNNYELSVDRLSAKERNCGLKITNFSGDLKLSPKGIYATNALIERDNETITCDVSMTEYNVFDDANLEKAVFKIEAETENFKPEIADVFVEMPIKYKGIQDVRIKANGRLNDFNIEELEYLSAADKIYLSGKLKNLLNPDDFSFDTKIKSSYVDFKSLADKIIGIPWENIPDIGKTSISYLNAQGNLDTVSAQASFKSQAGSFEGDLGVNLQDDLKYSAKVNLKQLNFAKILKSNSFSSDFTGNVNIKGEGVLPEKMLIDAKIKASKGNIADVEYESMSLALKTFERGVFSIDTLSMVFPNDSLSKDFEPYSKSKLLISGILNMNSPEGAKYSFDLNMDKINLARMLNNSVMPSVLSADLKINGENFDINTIKASVEADVSEMLLSDKYLMPFALAIKNSYDENKRYFNVKSDFLDLNLEGKFNYSDLIEALSNQSGYLTDFIQSKINAMLPDSAMQFNPIDSTIYEKQGSFVEQDLSFNAKVKNTSLVRSVMADIDFDMVADIDFNYSASQNRSNFSLSKCDIRYLKFATDDVYLQTDSLQFNGLLALSLQDSLPKFSEIKFAFDNDAPLFFNDFLIDSLHTRWNFDGKKFEYKIDSKFNSDFKINNKGSILLKDVGLDLTFSDLKLTYLNQLTWQNNGDINLDFTGYGLNINNFEMQRDKFEKFSIDGSIDSKEIHNLQISLTDFNLNHLMPVLPEAATEYIEELQGKVDSLNVIVYGQTDNPSAKMKFHVADIVVNSNPVGYYYGDMILKDNNLSGYTRLESNINGTIFKRLYADVFAFPLNISSDTTLHKSKLRVMARAEKFPLLLIEPFVPNVSNIRGEADAYLDISGEGNKDITWKGYVDLLKSQMRLDATNLMYNATGKIQINKDTINITKINLSNVKEEKYKGNAQVEGIVTLKDFLPDYIDLTIKANQFQVMNNSTVKSMPDMYGDFVISTDKRPLHFWGTLLKPNLEGDVNVVYASLKMPDMVTGKLQYSKLKYKINKDETLTIAIDNAKLEMPEQISQGFKASDDIAELMNYDLKIKILDKLSVQMDMGFLGQLSADVTIKDKNQPLLYKKLRDQQDAQLIGSLQLLESSVLNFAKMFNTYGEITFPTGDLQNPTLDLTAEYTGIIYEKPVQKNYTVKILVTGTKELPKTRFIYTINGEEATGDPKKIEEDALYLLVFGRLKGAESNATGASDVDNLKALLSGQASKYLTDILMKTGLVSSVDIEVNSDEFSESKMKFSGEMLGLNYQLGSTVGNMGDNQIIINIPFFKLFDNSILPNISGQVSISQSSGERNQLQERKKFEFKLRFGGSK